MTRSTYYLALTAIGTIVPYSFLIPWLLAHGLDLRLFVHDLFINRISTFFAADVLISAVVLLGYIRRKSGEGALTRAWIPTLATCLVGVSCGFPLLLWMLERPRPSDS